MSQNPLNLAVRFAIEIVAIACFAIWGWRLHGAIALRALVAVAAPLLAIVVWGGVATSRDVVRATKGPIMVSGAMRLAIELAVFFGAALAMYSTGYTVFAIAFACIVIVQSALSWDRWQRLLGADGT